MAFTLLQTKIAADSVHYLGYPPFTHTLSSAVTMTKSGETWVVTGASRGIGFEYVKQVRSCPPFAARSELQQAPTS